MAIYHECDAPTRAELNEPVRAWCPSCKGWRVVGTLDESFSHEFGIHRQYSHVCAECDLPRSQMLDAEPEEEIDLED